MKVTFPHPDVLQALQGVQCAVISFISGSLLISLGAVTLIQLAKSNPHPYQPNATEWITRRDRRPLVYSVGSLLSLTGLWSLYRSLWQPNICWLEVDRQQGLIRVEYRSLLRHSQTNYYRLQDARAIAFGKAQDAIRSPQPRPERKHITLLLNSGEFLVLTLTENTADVSAQVIAQFLSRSLET
ncbi:MAG: hypothetical protein AAGG51_23295 [Cyanobacteria bacterium P01_G01_bin.54]